MFLGRAHAHVQDLHIQNPGPVVVEAPADQGIII